MKRLLMVIAASAAFAGVAGANVVVHDSGTHSAYGPTTNSFKTFTVQAGDMIAVLGSGNNAEIRTASNLGVAGTAGFSWTDTGNIYAGAGVQYWYGTATGAGTVSLTYGHDTSGHIAIGAYQLRSDSGKDIELLNGLVQLNSENDPNIASLDLVYSFSETVGQGIVVEAFSSYNEFTAKAVTADVERSGKFGVGTASFLNSAGFTHSYSIVDDGANQMALGGMAFSEVGGSVGTNTLLESWQFNDTPGGQQLKDLANSAGTASWSADTASVTNDGNGLLVVSQGVNYYRNTDGLSGGAASNGTYEMEFLIAAADLSGGDASGANAGFGFRNAAASADLFFVRLQKQGGRLQLQTRIDSSNQTLYDFGTGVTSTSNFLVRSVIDLDADTAEVFYTLDGGSETSAGTVNLSTNVTVWDQMRFVAAANATDFGASDYIHFDYLTVGPEGNTGGGNPENIAPNDPNIVFQGSEYITRDANGTYFQRHSDYVLGLPVGERGFNDVKARTTTCIAMSFKTDSASVLLDFTHEMSAAVQNNGSVFVVYEDEVAISTNSFGSSESNLSFTVNSTSPGTASVFKVVLPLFAKPDFRGLQLDAGKTLLPYTLPAKRKYVAFGDSITHGQKQDSSPETYAWQLAEQLGMEVYNLAVGGGKVSIPAAEMLSEFPEIDLITILVGYNDLHFAEKTPAQYGADLNAMIDAARSNQPNAEIFCISPTFTTNVVDDVTGEHIQDFRQQVYDAVATNQAAGDTKIHLIRGEDITSTNSLAVNDKVHLSIPGAAAFADELFTIIDPIVNPAVTPQAGTNVLFIAIDDMKPLLGCYGDPLAITPNIDSLASAGVAFMNAQCQWAVCGPSRASLMTGLYPEETGVQGFKKMRGDADDGSRVNAVIRPNMVTLPQYFRYNGYTTAATGKLNDYRCVGTLNTSTGKVAEDGAVVDDPPSWGAPVNPANLPSDFFANSAYVQAASGWDPAGKPAVAITNLPDSAFTDGIACDEGISLLQNLAAGDNQFFLGVGFKKPHLGFYAPQQYWDMYTNTNFEVHPFQGHPENEVSYTWNYGKELAAYDDFYDPISDPGGSGISCTNIPAWKQLELLQGYYACASFIDAQVGRLLAELETLNLHTNTIVVLWGDHGFHLGDHGEWAKHTNLEQAARVPLVIYSPFTGAANAKPTAPANFTDIYPTVCELAGLPLPEQPLAENEAPDAAASGRAIKGRSLVPVMNDPDSSVQTGGLTLFSRKGAMGYSYRTERYRYIEWINKTSNTIVARELYDYENDPYETVNLASNTAHYATVYDLSTAMRAELDALKLSGTDLACPELQSLVLPPPTPQTGQTNILLVVIDDLGWMDLSIQGSEFYETPRIDELANNGMRFTQGYAAHPRCLPSRYGLMTGRFPGANGVPGGQPENCLRPWETTLAEALRDGGYATCFAGKWHLVGSHGADNLPQNQGFDVNFSGGKAGSPPTYFYPYRLPGTPAPTDELDKNALYFEEEGVAGEYVTDRLTDEALDWMTWNAHKPMFLCLWHYGVHTPFEAPGNLVAKYEAKLATMDYGNLPEYINVGVGEQKMRQDHPTYAAMIESVDTNIGRVMDQLDAMGIASNTVVILTSDNGGLSNRGGYNTRELATANWPLRTGKGWLYEGGVREAFIVSGAGVVPMVNSNAVVTGTDVFPTCLELAGLPLQPTNHHDGVSFVSALGGAAYDRGEPIFWHSPQARPYSTGDFNSSAVRDGDYKLIWFYDTPGQPYELYDVKNDPGETVDLAQSNPAKAAELLGLIQAWHAGAHEGSGVVFRPDEDDVAKPPQAYLDDPSVPLTLTAPDLSWGDYLGFDYNLYSKTNLLDATWTTEATGLATTNQTLPMVGDEAFYKVELVLQPES